MLNIWYALFFEYIIGQNSVMIGYKEGFKLIRLIAVVSIYGRIAFF